jgi:transposase
VLTLARELGNVSEACRIVGVSRRSYYEWKRIADEQGVEALRPKREIRRGPDLEADES